MPAHISLPLEKHGGQVVFIVARPRHFMEEHIRYSQIKYTAIYPRLFEDKKWEAR